MQSFSDLSCLPTQPASDAVFKLKLICTVSLFHALAMPFSSAYATLCIQNIHSRSLAGVVVHSEQEDRKHELLCSAFRSYVAPELHRSRGRLSFVLLKEYDAVLE